MLSHPRNRVVLDCKMGGVATLIYRKTACPIISRFCLMELLKVCTRYDVPTTYQSKSVGEPTSQQGKKYELSGNAMLVSLEYGL
jgi:hypothetical protein